MKIHIKRLRAKVTLPTYQTSHSAAMDLHAAVDEPVTLQPMERQLIPAGFAIAVPKGFEAQVRARSGLSLKYGIALANGVGTIDSDYRGEVGAIVINLGSEAYTIEPNDRIAQLVIAKYETVEWQEVSELEDSSRGSGGFGSTGR